MYAMCAKESNLVEEFLQGIGYRKVDEGGSEWYAGYYERKNGLHPKG